MDMTGVCGWMSSKEMRLLAVLSVILAALLATSLYFLSQQAASSNRLPQARLPQTLAEQCKKLNEQSDQVHLQRFNELHGWFEEARRELDYVRRDRDLLAARVAALSEKMTAIQLDEQ